MTRVVIVGEIYTTDPGQPPGIWGGAPPYVDIGGPGWQPRPSRPIAPGGRPPGYWGGVAPPHPDQGLPGVPPGFWGGVAPPYPDQGLPGAPPGFWGGVAPPHPDQGLPAGQTPGTPVPPEQLPPPDVPPELASQIIVSVYKPNEGWTTKSYPPR